MSPIPIWKSTSQIYTQAGTQDRRVDMSMIHMSKHWMLNHNTALAATHFTDSDAVEVIPVFSKNGALPQIGRAHV